MGRDAPVRSEILRLCVLRCQSRAMQRDSASHQGVPRLSTSARTKLLVSLGAAIVGGAAAAVVGAGLDRSRFGGHMD